MFKNTVQIDGRAVEIVVFGVTHELFTKVSGAACGVANAVD